MPSEPAIQGEARRDAPRDATSESIPPFAPDDRLIVASWEDLMDEEPPVGFVAKFRSFWRAVLGMDLRKP